MRYLRFMAVKFIYSILKKDRCCSCGVYDYPWKLVPFAFWDKHPDCPDELNYSEDL